MRFLLPALKQSKQLVHTSKWIGWYSISQRLSWPASQLSLRSSTEIMDGPASSVSGGHTKMNTKTAPPLINIKYYLARYLRACVSTLRGRAVE